MDVDKDRGGFTVQTAYPQRTAAPGLFAMHEGNVDVSESTDRHGVVATQQGRRQYRRPMKRITEP